MKIKKILWSVTSIAIVMVTAFNLTEERKRYKTADIKGRRATGGSVCNASKLLGVIVTIIILISCGSKTKNEGSSEKDSLLTINIDVKDIKSFEYDSLFSSVSYVPLETKEESFIGNIKTFTATDSCYIIFDNKRQAILRFDFRGHFINQIGIRGSGPDEYTYFNDIFYETGTHLVYAHERYLNKIFVYDLNGNLIRKTPKSKYSFGSFCKTEEGFWVYSRMKDKENAEGYNLMLLDENLQIQKAAHFPQAALVNSVSASTFTCDEAGTPYFFYPTSNIVYKLVDGVPLPFCKICFGDKTMPYELIAKMSNREEYEKLIANKSYLGDIGNFKVKNGKIYFSFSETGYNIAVKEYNCLFDISSRQSSVYQQSYIGGCEYPVWISPLTLGTREMIFPFYTAILAIDSKPIEIKGADFPITMESNPVLAIMKTK